MSKNQTPTIEMTARRVPTSNGSKGETILSLIAEHPDWNRKQIATKAGCTVQRVGEVIRYQANARKSRCEHEKGKKQKLGTCKACGPVAPRKAAK